MLNNFKFPRYDQQFDTYVQVLLENNIWIFLILITKQSTEFAIMIQGDIFFILFHDSKYIREYKTEDKPLETSKIDQINEKTPITLILVSFFCTIRVLKHNCA